MSIYDTLNTEQREACFQTQGPVLILAGAGSGKTRVLTHRICYLIDEEGVSPWNILAITFTNKAAGEMRERVDRLVGFGAESVWVSTFHSLCVRILRRHIDQLGYETGFTIYDADDSRTLMKQVMKTLDIDPKELKERTILGAISAAKNELMTPLRYRETHHFDYMERRIGEAYEEYQRQLHKNNALDFDDLLMKTVELFRSHEEVLENYQERFRYIMVDEYQDTNTAQFELIRLLSARYRNLCVVGDDDQSIYRFRGANIRNILDFEKLFPDARVIKLEQNYRSTQNVLDAANAVIHNNVNRKSKALWTNRGEGHKVHYRQLDNALDEADFIADDVKSKLRRDPKLHYRDFAVLYRTNAQARVLEERFVMESIPYRVVGGVNFYARKEIKDLLCYLKVIDNGADDLAVQRIINVPRRGIGATTIERIAEHARQRGIGFYEAMEESGQIVTLSRGAAGKISPFTEMIARFREYLRENSGQPAVLSELLRKILADTEYIEDLKAQDPEDAEDRLANIDELISKVVSYEEAAEEEPPTLSGFLEDVALVADIDSVGEEDDRVLLMTLHSAKGLEFSQVYLAGVEDGIFPGQMTIDTGDEEDMEEERRLAYVGITRAKDDLTITTARARMLRGETRFNPPSRFLYEIPEKLLDGKPAKPKNYLEEDFDFQEDGPFADYSGGWGQGRETGTGGFRTGGRTFVTYGKTGGQGFSGRSGFSGSRSSLEDRSSTGGRSADGRLRAVARKKQTADEHKPFIAQANERQKALSALTKGAPAGGGSLGYGVGDRVRHVKFGEGTVSAIEAAARDHKVTVQFDDYGQKVMYAAFAKLEKL